VAIHSIWTGSQGFCSVLPGLWRCFGYVNQGAIAVVIKGCFEAGAFQCFSGAFQVRFSFFPRFLLVFGATRATCHQVALDTSAWSSVCPVGLVRTCFLNFVSLACRDVCLYCRFKALSSKT